MEVTREIEFPVPPDEVWEALTDPDQLEEWYANDVELDPREGGAGVFRWEDGEERPATGVVSELTPQPLAGALDWMADVGGKWDARLARLRNHLSSGSER